MAKPLRTLALLGIGVGISSVAHAGKTKVLVLPYQAMGKGAAPELIEQTTGVIAQELGAAGLEIVRADDVAEAPVKEAPAKATKSKDTPTGDPSAGEKSQEMLARAKLSMEDSEFEAAIKQLKSAVKLLEDNGDAVPDLRLLPEAHLQLAVAYFRDGNEEEANEQLAKAVHLAPDRKLEETEYPPIFIRAYERVRFNVLNRPRARIEVKATPGAQVLFDGRNLGKAPIVLTEALPGAHWIRVIRPGEPVQVKRIQVHSKKTLSVEFNGGEGAEAAAEEAPVGVLGAIARNDLGKTHVQQLQGAGRRAGADFVLFGGIYKTETAYNIYTLLVSVSDGTVGRLVDIAFDLDMLSAQIEVYKVAEDAKKTVAARKFERPENGSEFALAPKVNLAQPKKTSRGPGGETRLLTVVAAPPPTAAPTKLAEAAVPAPEPAVVKPEPTKAGHVPKDEEGEGGPPSVAVTASGPPKGLASSNTAVVPRDEREDKDSGSNTWLWVLVGVVAVGAASAGGYFLLNNKPSNEGNLRIQW
jgi:tetratricopeptide (TPR) repeat protein